MRLLLTAELPALSLPAGAAGPVLMGVVGAGPVLDVVDGEEGAVVGADHADVMGPLKVDPELVGGRHLGPSQLFEEPDDGQEQEHEREEWEKVSHRLTPGWRGCSTNGTGVYCPLLRRARCLARSWSCSAREMSEPLDGSGLSLWA